MIVGNLLEGWELKFLYLSHNLQPTGKRNLEKALQEETSPFLQVSLWEKVISLPNYILYVSS